MKAKSEQDEIVTRNGKIKYEILCEQIGLAKQLSERQNDTCFSETEGYLALKVSCSVLIDIYSMYYSLHRSRRKPEDFTQWFSMCGVS